MGQTTLAEIRVNDFNLNIPRPWTRSRQSGKSRGHRAEVNRRLEEELALAMAGFPLELELTQTILY